MAGESDFVEVLLDTVRIAFRVEEIERVIRSVATCAVPGAPSCLLGMIDRGGVPVPLYETRRLMGLPTRGILATDRILLTRSSPACGLLVDDVLGLFSGEIDQGGRDFPVVAAGIRGIAHGPRGMVAVHDIGRFLALERAIPIIQECSHA